MNYQHSPFLVYYTSLPNTAYYYSYYYYHYWKLLLRSSTIIQYTLCILLLWLLQYNMNLLLLLLQVVQYACKIWYVAITTTVASTVKPKITCDMLFYCRIQPLGLLKFFFACGYWSEVTQFYTKLISNFHFFCRRAVLYKVTKSYPLPDG